MHLQHYAYNPLYTIIIMGDMNTDIYAESRQGKDFEALVTMVRDPRLGSCAEAAWPQMHQTFQTHGDDSAHGDSHIDYMLMTTSSASAVRRFGIDDNNPGITEDRGGRHSALFDDVDVNAVLGLGVPSSAGGGVQQHKSQIKYSDKPRLARFRNFATEFFDTRGLDGAVSALIGDVVLNEQLREEGERCRRDHEEKGWDEVRWRTRSASQGGEGTGDRQGRTAGRDDDGMAAGDGRSVNARGAGGQRRRPALVPGDESRGDSGRNASLNATTPDKTTRQRIDAAMGILDNMARDVDVAFAETHGGASRCREKPNPHRWGEGKRGLRRLMRFVPDASSASRWRSMRRARA
jgi:hypothetical protein